MLCNIKHGWLWLHSARLLHVTACVWGCAPVSPGTWGWEGAGGFGWRGGGDLLWGKGFNLDWASASLLLMLSWGPAQNDGGFGGSPKGIPFSRNVPDWSEAFQHLAVQAVQARLFLCDYFFLSFWIQFQFRAFPCLCTGRLCPGCVQCRVGSGTAPCLPTAQLWLHAEVMTCLWSIVLYTSEM